ncbi:MAG: cyanophycin synthetase [bacterium]
MTPHKSVFIVGIKGVAMTGIATILSQMKVTVHGSDTLEAQITDSVLTGLGIDIVPLDQALPEGTHLVIYSAAHGGAQSIQVTEARTKGIAIQHQAEWIAEYTKSFTTSIAVCGCHGKTGTSALLAYTLDNLGAKVSWLVGTSGFSGLQGGRHEPGAEVFVFEADEYALAPPSDLTPKLELYSPTHIICTNIDFDHPDVYRDLAHTTQVFRDFFKKASWVYECNSTSIEGNKKGIVAALHQLGYTTHDIEKSMEGFGGAKRRLEHYGHHHGVDYYDDYGHHPAEITATIHAIRKLHPNQRLLVMFQSHTYSRTQALKNEFVDALSHADQVYIDQIFPSAREKPGVEKITSHDLELIAQSKGYSHIHGYGTRTKLLSQVQKDRKSGDVILAIGAGDIYKVIDVLVTSSVL